MDLKAIIFDFDGVIVDSMDIKTQAFTKLFKDYPEYIDEIVQFHIDNGGMSRYEKFRIIYRDILHEPLSESRFNELCQRFSEYVYNEVLKCPFIPGALEFLGKYYKKLLLFIVSGTPQEEIKAIIKERNLDSFFAGVYGSPADKDILILNILKDYKLNPLEVISVGDSITDYEGALKARVPFIAKVKKEESQNPFAKVKVDIVIHDLFELEKYLSCRLT